MLWLTWIWIFFELEITGYTGHDFVYMTVASLLGSDNGLLRVRAAKTTRLCCVSMLMWRSNNFDGPFALRCAKI